MFKRQKKPGSLRINTLIGAGTRIIGDVQFTGGLHVDGAIQGNVESLQDKSATLSVSDSGLVEGLVQVPNVVLNGAVNGDIRASERVELGATAKVSGNVHYGLIEMAMGAQINGKLIHHLSGMPATPDQSATVSQTEEGELGYTGSQV
ncbi:MAG: polymer-forming cytoskeletal protein [Steroidobacteraceae bacterium]